jgi:2-polyprenyl-3-methyl-5-hydroxy-6-metoxy-1,4-benzoquinol methylase
MLFASPVSRRLIGGQFYADRTDSYYLSPDKLEGDYAPVRFERELSLFRSFCPKGHVLDVGCSTGGFLYQLSTQFPREYQVVGVDVAAKALDYAESRGVPVRRGAFPELEFGEQRFDAITFWAVLEHLVNPGAFVAKAATLLKPGGHLFILVPNMESLAVRVLGCRYRYIVPEHVNYFTARPLRRLAETSPALKVLALRSTHFNPIVLWQDFWRGATEVPDVQRAKLLRRTIAWKQKPALLLVRKLYFAVERMLGACQLADNLMLVARRTR